MDGEEIYPLYEWATGICFRHPQSGDTDTTCIQILRPRTGPAREVRACRDCVLALEAERQEAAVRREREYVPGRLGCRAQ
jgi:hypothetical protein